MNTRVTVPGAALVALAAGFVPQSRPGGERDTNTPGTPDFKPNKVPRSSGARFCKGGCGKRVSAKFDRCLACKEAAESHATG